MSDIVRKFAGVALAQMDAEHRVEDVELAKWLEYDDVRSLRKLIRDYSEFLKRSGFLRVAVAKSDGTRGRPGRSYWLNKKQALFVASKSDKPKGSEILLVLIEAFETAEREALERAASKSYIYRRLFLEIPVHTEYLWTPGRLGPIAALYGVKYSGGRAPVETRRIQREIYDLIVGLEMIATLREKYPDPPGENGAPYIYDHFHPEVRTAVEAELDKVAAIAETSTSRDDFRSKLRAKYGTSMLQLVFGGKQSGQWTLPPSEHPDPE